MLTARKIFIDRYANSDKFYVGVDSIFTTPNNDPESVYFNAGIAESKAPEPSDANKIVEKALEGLAAVTALIEAGTLKAVADVTGCPDNMLDDLRESVLATFEHGLCKFVYDPDDFLRTRPDGLAGEIWKILNTVSTLLGSKALVDVANVSRRAASQAYRDAVSNGVSAMGKIFDAEVERASLASRTRADLVGLFDKILDNDVRFSERNRAVEAAAGIVAVQLLKPLPGLADAELSKDFAHRGFVARGMINLTVMTARNQRLSSNDAVDVIYGNLAWTQADRAKTFKSFEMPAEKPKDGVVSLDALLADQNNTPLVLQLREALKTKILTGINMSMGFDGPSFSLTFLAGNK